MSLPSSTSTQSANAFPKQAGVALQVPDANPVPTSPSASQFSFESSPHSAHGIEQIAAFPRERPATQGGTTATRRAQYYEDQFAYKEGTASSARDRVTKDAPIIADLKTNVIVCCSSVCTLSMIGANPSCRSRMNTPSSLISHTTCRHGIRDQNHPL